MKAVKLIVFLVVVGLMATPALAAGGSSDQGSSDQGAGGAAKMSQAEGRIDKLDPSNKTMEVARGEGLSPLTLKVDRSTEIMDRNGAKVDFSTLKQGDRVWASYHRKDNQDVAQKITIMSPTAGPKHGASQPAAPGAGQ